MIKWVVLFMMFVSQPSSSAVIKNIELEIPNAPKTLYSMKEVRIRQGEFSHRHLIGASGKTTCDIRLLPSSPHDLSLSLSSFRYGGIDVKMTFFNPFKDLKEGAFTLKLKLFPKLSEPEQSSIPSFLAWFSSRTETPDELVQWELVPCLGLGSLPLAGNPPSPPRLQRSVSGGGFF